MIPSGVTAVYILGDRVIAHTSDFHQDCPSGYTLHEAQAARARRLLAGEVVRALASPALYEGMETYDFEQVVRTMKGHVVILTVGGP